jgi:hypothetical protein
MTISSTSKSSITCATMRLNPETPSSFTPTSSPWTWSPRRVSRLSSSMTSAIAMIVPIEVAISRGGDRSLALICDDVDRHRKDPAAHLRKLRSHFK